MSLEQEIKERALALGCDAVGITDASPLGAEHGEHLEAWLRRGYAGRMEYMHHHLEKRIDPAQLRKGARSVIVVALNYKPPSSIAECGLRIADSRAHDKSSIGASIAPGMDNMPRCQTPNSGSEDSAATASPIRNPQSEIRNQVGQVAHFAQYEDYHQFLKDLLRELAGFLYMRSGHQDRYKICVDSAPVAEKALAVRAGLGFLGRNHLLIHPQLGPEILLGEIVTMVELHPDKPMEGSCTGCDRCLRACPTGALRPDGFLDARRCISYLTQYGSPDESAGRTDNWLFGCDECLRACPFQQSAPVCANRRFRWYAERAGLDLQEVLGLSNEEFETRLHDSPIKRLGLEKLKDNARRCLSSQISNPEI